MRKLARDWLVGFGVFLVVGGAGGFCAALAEAKESPPAAEKVKISSRDELPKHTYPLQGTVAELLADQEAFDRFKDRYRRDLEADLDKYQIEDPDALQGIFGRLAVVYLLDGRYDDALALLDEVRSLEEKEAARLFDGLVSRSLIATWQELDSEAAPDVFLQTFRGHLQAMIEPLPWDVVQDQVKAGKARAEFMSPNLLEGVVQAQIEPAAAAMGELDGDLAGSIISIRFAQDHLLQVYPTVAEIYSAYIEQNQTEKQDIWPERDYALAPGQDLAPVIVGIWDSGVDAMVFEHQMFVNPLEAVDGRDTDGNGFVDDVHGIAFDLAGRYSTDLLHPLGDQAGNLEAVYEYMQGFTDLTSAIESPAAAAVRQKMSTMPPEEVGDFMTSLSFGGLYMHGTHVAGIALAGNPYARVLAARITFDYHNIPQPMTVEVARRLADAYVATTAYFQTHGVRAVNMSWGWTFQEIESSLSANGVGESAEERAAMAKEMIGILSDGLQQAMSATPEILYVVAAGNDDSDVEFDVVIPSNFDLPNLIVVGAVDQAGDPTSFTSGGRNVRVYASGFQVDSFVPGGQRMKMSGTSMAAPNVCNLAAKLFSLQPDLTPEKVSRLIEQGADPNPDHPHILLINPRKTVSLLAG
jgi:subtilisin family serine protease